MTTSNFDVDSLRLGVVVTRSDTKRVVKDRFVKGPIPLPWIKAAARLKVARAMHVAVAIFYRSGLRKAETVKISPGFLAEFGVNRSTGYRALEALEGAGLVSVERRRGHAAVVTILAVRPHA